MTNMDLSPANHRTKFTLSMEAFFICHGFWGEKICHACLFNVAVLNLINGFLKATCRFFLTGLQPKLLRFESAQRSYKGPWLLPNSILHVFGTRVYARQVSAVIW